MTDSESTMHLTSCDCPACTGQSLSSDTQQYSSGNTTENLTVTGQDLAMPGGTANYIKSLFGTDSAVWSNGGAGSAAFGNAVTIYYTFGTVSWANPFGYSGGSAFSSAEQTAASAAMQMWSSIANITFVQGTSATAKIAFHNYDLPPGVGGEAATWTYNDNGGGADRIAQSEVTMDVSTTGYTAGQYGWLAMIHEIGHALGLKHPGNYNAGGGGADGPYLTDSGLTDSQDFTVMSYYQGVYASSSHYASTPMLYDIAAIQYLYGANHSYHSGNDTYTMTGTGSASTIWDGAGTDTLSSTGYSGNVTLDLREGETYISHVGNSHSWNAFGANIENASSGGGNDSLYGNGLANVLNGGDGNDTLYGGLGNDTLVGGNGTDVYSIAGNGDGSDTISDSDGLGLIKIDGISVTGTATSLGGNAWSLLAGGVTFNLSQSGTSLSLAKAGGSTLVTIADFISGAFNITTSLSSGTFGSGSNDKIAGTLGNDELYGLGGDDKLDGGKSGQDTIYGGSGNDNIKATGANAELYGDDGNDSVSGSGANSILDGGDGNDVLAAGGLSSTVTGGAGDDVITAKQSAELSGDDGNDKITGSKLADTIDGGAGNDTLYGGAGNDIIVDDDGGTNYLYGDAGNDTITSGSGVNYIYGGAGTDTIHLEDGDGTDTIYYNDVKDVSIVAGGNVGYETISDFEDGIDQIKFGSKLLSAWDDIAKDANFTFAEDTAVNFNTTHEAWLVTGVDDAALTQFGFTDLLAELTGLGVTASKKADGLIVVESDSHTAVYSYVENGVAINNISMGELTLLTLIDGTLGSTSFDF